MKNILHLSQNSYPNLSENFSTKEIWRELAKPFDKYFILARSKINRFQKFTEGNIVLFLVPSLLGEKFFALENIFLIPLIIMKYKIKVVVSQCPLQTGLFLPLYKVLLPFKTFQEIHDSIYFTFKYGNFFKKILNFLFVFILKKADKIRSLNSSMTFHIINLSKYTFVNKIVEIPNRVNLNLFNSVKYTYKLNNPITITTVGTFVHRKGYDILFKAIESLSTFNFLLNLIGGGVLEKEFNQISLANCTVIVKSKIPQSNIAKILQSSDIYIQPSRREALPRTILEAMASGVPVIASNIMFIDGLIEHGINGLLFSSENYIDLAEKIKMLINNDTLRSNIGNKGFYDILNNFEWSRTFTMYTNTILDFFT